MVMVEVGMVQGQVIQSAIATARGRVVVMAFATGVS